MLTQLTRQRRVLIVNGFTDGREMYVAYLRHNSLSVREATSPTTALPLVRRFQPDVIVTDFVFRTGSVDGPGFINAVRQMRDAINPTIIVVSGFTQKRDERRARDAGADAFLIKPCLPEQLLFEVQRALAVRSLDESTR